MHFIEERIDDTREQNLAQRLVWKDMENSCRKRSENLKLQGRKVITHLAVRRNGIRSITVLNLVVLNLCLISSSSERTTSETSGENETLESVVGFLSKTSGFSAHFPLLTWTFLRCLSVSNGIQPCRQEKKLEEMIPELTVTRHAPEASSTSRLQDGGVAAATPFPLPTGKSSRTIIYNSSNTT